MDGIDREGAFPGNVRSMEKMINRSKCLFCGAKMKNHYADAGLWGVVFGTSNYLYECGTELIYLRRKGNNRYPIFIDRGNRCLDKKQTRD